MSASIRVGIQRGSRAPFSLTEARGIVKDLFTPRPAIYWADFLASYALGTTLLFACRRVLEVSSPWFYAAFAVQCLAFYRASLFIHELVHLREGTMTAFRVVWNLLCGIPFLTPSFVYYTHIDHHRRAHYGTRHDGEYLPLGNRPAWHLLPYLALSFVIPVVAVFRFLVLTPLTWISPAVRDFALRRMSSLVMDPSYLRPLPTRRTMRIIRWQELGCFAFLAVLLARMSLGYTPWTLVPHAYATAVTIVLLNSLRTLGSHRWTSRGERMTFLDQLLDSVNYPHRPWITALWGPLGLRFHALHHLFPSMPYHHMGTAHRRLMQRLPADSPYRATNRQSLIDAVLELWRRPRVRSDAPLQTQSHTQASLPFPAAEETRSTDASDDARRVDHDQTALGGRTMRPNRQLSSRGELAG